jgi:predicted ABC-type exoprotein transport system permease subunit
MLRPVLTIAAIGIAGVAIWKLLWLLLFPLVGTLLGLAMVGVKVLLFALVIFALWRLFFRRRHEPASS